MDRLLELLARINDLTDDERAELGTLMTETLAANDDGRFPDLTDEALAEFAEASRAAAVAISESATPDVELLTSLVESNEAVSAETSTRSEEATAQAATIAELVQRVATNEPAASTEGDDPDGDDGDEGDGDDESKPAEAVAVTAATKPAARRSPTPMSAVAQRSTGQADAPEAEAGVAQTITAAAGLRDHDTGADLTPDQVAEAMHKLAREQRTPVRRGFGKFHVASIRTEYPEDRRLDLSDATRNYERLHALRASLLAGRDAAPGVGSAEALVAAGGLCAPLLVRYAVDTVGSDYRPVRDALMATDGSRGGVRLIPPPVLSSVGVDGEPGDDDATVSIWTNEDDEAVDPDDPTTWKSYERIVCSEPVDFETHAVVARKTVGNHLANTFPEWVRAAIDLTGVAWSRQADSQLLAQIAAASTQVAGYTGTLGSAKHFLEEIDAAAWATRNRHRVPQNTPVRVFAPDVLLVHMRTDIAKELPAGSTAERLAVAEASINQFFTARNVVVTWTPDLIVAGAQGAGALNPLPTEIQYGIGLDGLFAFMDGASIDLGFMAGTPQRDNTSNAQNDFHLFMESWEGIAKFGGPEHLWVTTTLCPNGATVGTVEPEACAS